MIEFDLLGMGIHHKDYWTIWVGRVAVGHGDKYTPDASLLKIGLHGCEGLGHSGLWRWRFDILWLTFFIRRARNWLYNRKRKQQWARAVRVEADCLCGHDIQAHSEEGAYFMVPCKLCECAEYMPAEHPYCECGHSGDQHFKLASNLFLGCIGDCDCEIYTPESIMGRIARLCHELTELMELMELMEENAE